MRCRGSGRVHKVPHLLWPPWNLPGASLELRSQREGRAVRGVDLGQLCNHCLPGSSVAVVGGGGGAVGDRNRTVFFSIRKQHTVNKGTRVQGNGSEYFRGVVFSYSFSMYCAAYHGIWCSVRGT